jgi:hypothetical protein
MMKKIVIGFVAMIMLAAGAGYYFLYLNLDSIVKAAIEKYGTEAAHSEVKLDGVKLSIPAGEAAIKGLTLANPNGFSPEKALSFGIISVKLDTASVTGSGPIIIREITIDSSQVKFEANNSGDSNLQVIERNTTSNSVAAPSAAASSSGKHEPGRKVIINDLYIRNAQIEISHPLLKGKPLNAPLPTIHLTNIGKDNNGASPSQVADLVLKSITSDASKIAISDLAKNLGSLKNVAGALKNVPAGASEKILNRVNGLLGK